MADSNIQSLAKLIGEREPEILAAWTAQTKAGVGGRSGRISEAEHAGEAKSFLSLLRQAMSTDFDPQGPAFASVRDFLDELSRSRAAQGFMPAETAAFVFALKRALFEATEQAEGDRASNIWALTELLDALGLYTVEAFQKSRESIIIRQQREITELSTPVVKLWDGVLALPLIGTLDSERTQVVMENLLQAIVDNSADIAVIDITGVPTVDTLVAQHLLKTVAAARLMGADCVISGIRPQIAQTMVHLGVELDVITKPTLADAFAVALQRQGRTVVRIGRPTAAATTAS